jgi:hypothetical protein
MSPKNVPSWFGNDGSWPQPIAALPDTIQIGT